MKTVYLIRHSKSDWDSPFVSDHERGLSPRGVKNANALRKFLRTRKIQFDVSLVSSAFRAQETYRIISKISNLSRNFNSLHELYDAEPEVYIQNLQKLPDTMDKVLIIGHNPEMETVIHSLIGLKKGDQTYSIFTKFPTSGLIALNFDTDEWTKIPETVKGSISLFWFPIKGEKK